jgi:hypothetical protein
VSRPGFPRRAPVSSPGRHTTRRRGSMLHHMMARATGRRLLGGVGAASARRRNIRGGRPLRRAFVPAAPAGSGWWLHGALSIPTVRGVHCWCTPSSVRHTYVVGRTRSIIAASFLFDSQREEKRQHMHGASQTCTAPPLLYLCVCSAVDVRPGRATRQAITGRGGLSRNSVVEPSLAHPCTVAQTARHLQLAPPQIFVLHFRTVGPRRWRTRHATYYTGYDMPAEDGTTDEDEKEPTVL